MNKKLNQSTESKVLLKLPVVLKEVVLKDVVEAAFLKEAVGQDVVLKLSSQRSSSASSKACRF